MCNDMHLLLLIIKCIFNPLENKFFDFKITVGMDTGPGGYLR